MQMCPVEMPGLWATDLPGMNGFLKMEAMLWVSEDALQRRRLFIMTK